MTDSDDTDTALVREEQDEAAYQESRRLALEATEGEPDGPACWEYDELFRRGWCISLLFYSGTDPDTSDTVWSDFDHDTISCDDRETARALATSRNTPPRLQANSPESATPVTDLEEER